VNDDTVKVSLGLGNGALSVAAENENYQRVVEQRCGPVAPFSLKTFGLCIGSEALSQLMDKLVDDVLRDSRYKEFLGEGELTEAQLQQLYQALEEEVNVMLGPIQDIIEAVDAVTPQAVQDLEEWLQGHIEGVIGEEELAKIGQIEIPEMGQSFFDCDDE